LPFLSRLLPLFLSESGQLTSLITGCLPFPGFLLFQQLLLCFGLQSLLFGRLPCSLFRSL
jgi:purine-cytosine permease-like protein